jgi:hypothetical protein
MSKQPTLAANSLAPIRLAYANERFRFPGGRLLIENNNLVELLPR